MDPRRGGRRVRLDRRPRSRPSSTCWSSAARPSGAPGGGWSATATAGPGCGRCSPCPVLTGAFGRLGSGVHLHTDHDLDWDYAALLRRGARHRRRGRLGPPGQVASPGEPEPARPAADRPGRRAADPRARRAGRQPGGDEPGPGQGAGRARPATTCSPSCTTRCSPTRPATPTSCCRPPPTSSRPTSACPTARSRSTASPAVIDRVGESRTNDELSAGLAARLGFAAGPGEAFDPDPERLRSLALPGGVPGRRRRPRRRARRCSSATSGPTPARDGPGWWPAAKAQAKGAARVPTYQRLDSDLPLTLVSPANARTINSIFGDTEGPSPAVHLHPDDAAARGLLDGQDVTVVGASGVARHRRGRRRRPPSGRGLDAEGAVAPSRRWRVHRQRLRAGHAERPGRRGLLQRRKGRRPTPLTSDRSTSPIAGPATALDCRRIGPTDTGDPHPCRADRPPRGPTLR